MNYNSIGLSEFCLDKLRLSNGQTAMEFVMSEGNYIRTVSMLNRILALRGIEKLTEEELEAARRM